MANVYSTLLIIVIIIHNIIPNRSESRWCTADGGSNPCECTMPGTCNLNCIGTDRCKGSDFVLKCMSGHLCNINCNSNGGEKACADATIDASQATDLNVICQDATSCMNVNVNCGTGRCQIVCNNTGSGGQECDGLILNCGSEVCTIECNLGTDGLNTCNNVDINLQPNRGTRGFQCIRPGTNNQECDMIDQAVVPFIIPTPSPTISPTLTPTSSPSAAPTNNPTVPTLIPSYHPTTEPTYQPTLHPTTPPTYRPTLYPSINPTKQPSLSPTKPTISPTMYPTDAPTLSPTNVPSVDPTNDPTIDPTGDPTPNPTTNPTIVPTNNPTYDPTDAPTNNPTNDPTSDPTDDPTTDPTDDPTQDPTSDPTNDPTIDPTSDPTSDPTNDPTSDPTIGPTTDPSIDPTSDPTFNPTKSPIHNECILNGQFKNLDVAFLVDNSCGLTEKECQEQQEGIAELLTTFKKYNNPRIMYITFSNSTQITNDDILVSLDNDQYNDLAIGGEQKANLNFINLYNLIRNNKCGGFGDHILSSTNLNIAINYTLHEFKKHIDDDVVPPTQRYQKMVIFSNCKSTDSVDPCNAFSDSLQISILRKVEVIIINVKTNNYNFNENTYLKCFIENDNNRYLVLSDPSTLLTELAVPHQFQNEICRQPTSDPTTDPTFVPTNDPTQDPTYDPTNNPTNNPTLQPTFATTDDIIIAIAGDAEKIDQQNQPLWFIITASGIVFVCIIEPFLIFICYRWWKGWKKKENKQKKQSKLSGDMNNELETDEEASSDDNDYQIKVDDDEETSVDQDEDDEIEMTLGHTNNEQQMMMEK